MGLNLNSVTKTIWGKLPQKQFDETKNFRVKNEWWQLLFLYIYKNSESEGKGRPVSLKVNVRFLLNAHSHNSPKTTPQEWKRCLAR